MVIYGRFQKSFIGSAISGTLIDNIISYYKLENDSIVDDVNGYSSSVSGTVTISNGIIGSCISLPGTTAIPIIDSNITPSIFYGITGLTVSAWINPATVATGVRQIVGNRGASAVNFLFTHYSGGCYFYVADSTANGSVITPQNLFTSGGWSHVVATFNSGSINIYVNGSIQGSGNVSLTSLGSVSDSSLRFGRNTGSATQQFNGRIDEVGLWKKPLSSTDVNNLYGLGTGLTYYFNCPYVNIPSGTYFDDTEYINYVETTSDNNNSSNFSATLPNQYGQHNNDFNIGDEVKIYIDKDTNPPTTLLFTGTIEDINVSDQGSVKNNLVLSGRDYTSLLQNVTVEPSVFNTLDAGSIVRSLVAEFAPEIGIGSINDTGFVVNHVSYNHTPLFDAIAQMAGYVDYEFFVDEYKNLNFRPRGTIVNSVTLGSSNVTSARFKNSNRQMFNQIWVYGDRILSTAPVETFTSNGVGSVITLAYKPHNVEVRASGTTVVKGAVFNMAVTPSSGTQYMVDYDAQQIIWVSGPGLGNCIPGSLTISTVYYDRSLPIIKYIQSNESVEQYGPSAKIIQDKNIKDPRQAADIAKAQLNEFGFPKEQGNIFVQGIAPLRAGTKIPVFLPYHGISGTYNIFQVNYNLTKANCLSEQVMTLNVGTRIPDVTDTLKKAILDLRRLQVGDISDADILTRIEATVGSVGFKVASWSVSTCPVGSDWYLGSPASMMGWVGSPGSYWVGSHSLTWTVAYSGGE